MTVERRTRKTIDRTSVGYGALVSQFPSCGSKDPFPFRPRAGKLNIRLLHAVDPEQVMVSGDAEIIRVHMDNLTFAKIQESDVQAFNDDFVAKLLNLMQLTMEYLHTTSQNDRVVNNRLTETNLELEHEMSIIDGQMSLQKSRLDHLHKENKYKTRQLTTYEQLLGRVSDGQSRHPCTYCGKHFESEYYLKNHMARKHGDKKLEDEAALVSTVDTMEASVFARTAPTTAESVPKLMETKEAVPVVAPMTTLEAVPVLAAVSVLATPVSTVPILARVIAPVETVRATPLATTETAPRATIPTPATPPLATVPPAIASPVIEQQPPTAPPVEVVPTGATTEMVEQSLVVPSRENETSTRTPRDSRFSLDLSALHAEVEKRDELTEKMIKESANKVNEQVSSLRQDFETHMNRMRQDVISMISDIKAPLDDKVDSLAKVNETLQENLSNVNISQSETRDSLHDQIKELKLLLEATQRKKSKAGDMESDTDSDTTPVFARRTMVTVVESAMRSSQQSLLSQISSLQEQSKQHNRRLEDLMKDRPQPVPGVKNRASMSSKSPLNTARTPRSASVTGVVSHMSAEFDDAPVSVFDDAPCRKDSVRNDSKSLGKGNKEQFLVRSETREMVVTKQNTVDLTSAPSQNMVQAFESVASSPIHNRMSDVEEDSDSDPDAAMRASECSRATSPTASSSSVTSETPPRSVEAAETPPRSSVSELPEQTEAPPAQTPEMDSHEIDAVSEAKSEESEIDAEPDKFAVEQKRPLKELESIVDDAFRASWQILVDRIQNGPQMADSFQCEVTYADGAQVMFQQNVSPPNPPRLVKVENGVEYIVDKFIYDETDARLADFPSCPEGRHLPAENVNNIITSLQRLASALGVPGLDTFVVGIDVERYQSRSKPGINLGQSPRIQSGTPHTTPLASNHTTPRAGTPVLSARGSRPVAVVTPRLASLRESVEEVATFGASLQMTQNDEEAATFGASQTPQNDEEVATFDASQTPQNDEEAATFDASQIPQHGVASEDPSSPSPRRNIAESSWDAASNDVMSLHVSEAMSSPLNAMLRAHSYESPTKSYPLQRSEEMTFNMQDRQSNVPTAVVESDRRMQPKRDQAPVFSRPPMDFGPPDDLDSLEEIG